MASPKLDVLKTLKINRPQKEVAGDKGEIKVFVKLNDYSRKLFCVSKLIENFYYRFQHGTREIDLIYIFRKGVFVIEIKNWKGYIKGSIGDSVWTNIQGKKTKTYKNPITQNKSHVNDIKRMLGNNVPVHPLIVFTSENVGHLSIPLVINFSDLDFYLDRFNSSITLSDQNVLSIHKRLLEIKNRDNVSRDEHIKNSKNTKEYEAKKKYEANLPDIVKRVRAKQNLK